MDNGALQCAVEAGVKQLEQQMILGGGNLNELFEKVISEYLKEAATRVCGAHSKQCGYDTREDSCKGSRLEVREMTVEEAVKIMWEPCDNYNMSNSAALKLAARALAALGTIRIVGDV